MANVSSSPSSTPSFFLVFLSTLSFFLAAFAFLLQWRCQLPNSFSPSQFERDMYLELSSMLRSAPVPSSSSTSFSSDCADTLGKSRTPPFQHYKNWKFISELSPDQSDRTTKVCITATTSAGLDQILPWIFYHKFVGVAKFFLFVEGKAASINVSRVLKYIPGVEVIHRTRELEEQQAKSRFWNETWLANHFYRPCNYELFVKQTLNMEMAIAMAREAGMDWIMHIDTDELLHPAGTSQYSVQQLLSDVPENVDMESAVERDDIEEPFSEVSMFKMGFYHIDNETYFETYEEARRNNPNIFLTYENGKSAARIQDHLRPHGAHRWENYIKYTKEMYLDEAVVLHYAYAKFSDLTSRRDRCHCKPTKEDSKRCFILEFDRIAFLVASTLTKEEMLIWYRQQVVWTDKELTNKLLRKGIMRRIYAPMVIVQRLRESGIYASVIASALSNKHIR